MASAMAAGRLPESGFPFIWRRSKSPQNASNLKDELDVGISARHVAIVLLPIALAGCLDSEDSRTTTFMEDSSATPRYPDNYRPELLAFLRTYLNNPVGVRNAEMADPVQRTVAGKQRYVSCLRYYPRESDGTYREMRERAVMYVNGRLDRLVENASEVCAGAAYAPFPEMEKMQR